MEERIKRTSQQTVNHGLENRVSISFCGFANWVVMDVVYLLPSGYATSGPVSTYISKAPLEMPISSRGFKLPR